MQSCRSMPIDSPSDSHPHHRMQDLQSHTYQCRRSLPLYQYLNYQIEYHSPQWDGGDREPFLTHVSVDPVTVRRLCKDRLAHNKAAGKHTQKYTTLPRRDHLSQPLNAEKPTVICDAKCIYLWAFRRDGKRALNLAMQRVRWDFKSEISCVCLKRARLKCFQLVLSLGNQSASSSFFLCGKRRVLTKVRRDCIKTENHRRILQTGLQACK